MTADKGKWVKLKQPFDIVVLLLLVLVLVLVLLVVLAMVVVTVSDGSVNGIGC